MKAKNIFIIAAVLLAPSLLKVLPFGKDLGWASCFSQGTWPWAKASQGAMDDNCWNTTADAAGNVFVTGYFYSPTITFGATTLTSAGGSNFYIAKYDAAGNALWAQSAGNGQLANGFSVAADASGNVYAAGTYYGAPITFGSFTLPYVTLREIFLVKYDASGNVLWAKGVAGTGDEDVAWGVAADAFGNVYITGGFDSPTVTFGTTTLTNVNPGPGVHDIFIVKYDASGNVLWAQSVGGTSSDVATDIITDASGNVYITGGFRSPALTFGATTLTQTGASFNNSFLVKYDASGNALWAKQSVQQWKCAGHALAVNPSGTAVYLLGIHHMSSVSFGSFVLPQQGFWDGFFVKYDASSGNELCALNIGELNANADIQAWGLAVDISGNVYASGSAWVNNSILIGSYTLPIPAGLTPFFMVVFDPNCNVICIEALPEGAGGLNRRTAVTANPLGDVYVASTFDNTFTVGTTTLALTPSFSDIWVAKYVKCSSSALAVSTTQTNPLCNSQCTGTATAAPTGGTSPYTYSWNTTPVQNTQTATGLCAGSYSVLVTDATGNTATSNITITQPTAITAAATATAAACGSSNGSAAVSASNGTSPYTYLWSNNSTTQQISNLSAGNYSVIVTDANGCTQTATVAVTQTGGPAVATSATPQTCAQGGTASASATGGTAPYTYQWCNGQTTSTATNLSAGSCTVIVTDASGCSTINTVTITSSGNIPTATVTATPAFCGNNNGTATATVSGGTSPYTYLWNPSAAATATATGLSAGTYTVTVTDAVGCTAMQTVTVPQSSAITATATATAAACGNNNGSATVSASGGTAPYTYLWNPSAAATATATGLSAGTYIITITDVNGCTQTATAVVTSTGGPTATAASNVTITQGQSVTLTASGGGTYSWSPATGLSCTTCSNPIATPPFGGQGGFIYCVTVTDASNCSDTACVTVTVNIEPVPCGNIYIPNAFSPNGDGENDMFSVRGNCITQMRLVIYNRWGEKVFETTDQNPGWDGSYKGKIEDTAVFAFIFEATHTNGEKISKKGNISLLR